MLSSHGELFSKFVGFDMTITVIGQQFWRPGILNIISDSAMYCVPQATY